MIDTIILNNVLPRVFAGSENEPPVNGSQVWLQKLEFHQSQSYLIEAESGTGKSSLCSFIYGNRCDYSGEILFDGYVNGGRNVGVFHSGTDKRKLNA